MLSKPTTFVIGAGASVPYGFPDGRTLYQQAIALTPDTEPYIVLRQHMGSDAEHLPRLLDELRRDEGASVDGYLATRADDHRVQQFGRALIVLLVGTYHLKQRATGFGAGVAIEEDWLSGVLATMCSGTTLDRFSADNSNTRFVTFNFDLLIEQACRHVFGRAFVPSLKFGQENQHVDPLIKALDVIHVHGHFRLFEGLHPFWIPRAVDELRIVSDRPEDKVLMHSQAAIRQADVICFLGFGFHPDNLRKLGLAARLQDGRPCTLYASGVGMNQDQRSQVSRQVRHAIAFGDANESCRRFLERVGLIRA